MSRKRNLEEKLLNQMNDSFQDGKNTSDDWKKKNDSMMDTLYEIAGEMDKAEEGKKQSSLGFWVVGIVIFVVVLYVIFK